MQPIYRAFTAGYADMRPECVAAHERHAVRSAERKRAYNEALAAGATKLEADAAGDTAYHTAWAKRVMLRYLERGGA